MEVSGQLHTPAALSPPERDPAGWASDSVWTLWRREDSFISWNRKRVFQPVARLYTDRAIPAPNYDVYVWSIEVLVLVTVAARSKAWTAFAHSDAGIVGSNLTQCIDACVCMRLFCVCVVLCLCRGLVTGWSLVQGVLPTVYRITELNERPGPWMGSKSRWKKNNITFSSSKLICKCRIWGSHCGGYEEFFLVGYNGI
jgi:hypothetical protein